MNLIAWLIAGGVIGLLASTFTGGPSGRTSRWLNVVAGFAGALIGGSLFGPMISGAAADPQAFGITTFVVSVVGAIVMLMVVRMLLRAVSE